MLNPDIRAKYTATIGIECHVQLKTKTKLFSGADNDAREADPNTLVNHIDFGMPGALPVLNGEAVKRACRAAFALGTRPQSFSKFDRKHYFYPDLPMGYQISQFDEPIIIGGEVRIRLESGEKTIRITRAHLEADAGKSTHPAGTDYSLVDLNRAGTPLLEIVSEPDMHSAEEAKAYAKELHLLMRYADVSDANLYYGNMRFDVNVSVSDSGELGTRTETKNLNSFRSVERAIEYEIERQIEVLESGEKVVQETRGWDDDKQATFSQRSKEDAHDYRYMPDPDLPPIVIEEDYINQIEQSMLALPGKYREILESIGIDAKTTEDIINDPSVARAVAEARERSSADDARRVAFWLLRPVDTEESVAEEVGADVDSDTIDRLISLSRMVGDNQLSSTAAKEVLADMLTSGEDPKDIAERKNLLQVSDEGAIAEIVAGVLSENAKAADDVRNGEMKAIGFLVGQVMKASKGKANPALATKLIKEQLNVK